jgi:hypothetical protein
VKTIGDYAFSDCTLLEKINWPCSLTTIGDGAFENCTSLSIPRMLPTGITLGTDVFNGCLPPTIKIQDPEDDCAICREILKTNLVQLGCSHVYHQNCIMPWKNAKNTCPQCVNPIESMTPAVIDKKRRKKESASGSSSKRARNDTQDV